MVGLHLHLRSLSRAYAFTVPELPFLYSRYQNRPEDMVGDGGGGLATWLDSANGNYTLTRLGAPQLVSEGGKLHAYLPPSGSNYLDVNGPGLPVNSSYTFIARVRFGRYQDGMALFGSAGQHALIFRDGGYRLDLYANNYIVQNYHGITPGQWFTVIATYDNSTGIGAVYINDQTGVTGGGGSPHTANLSGLTLGSYSNGNLLAQDVSYRAVVVYNTVLSAPSRAAWRGYLQSV